MRAQIRTCTSQLSVFDVSEKMQFGNNDLEEESAANSVLTIPPQNSVKRSGYNSATFAE